MNKNIKNDDFILSIIAIYTLFYQRLELCEFG